MKTIKIKIPNNPDMEMTIPLNQIIGFKAEPVIEPFHHGHLRDNSFGNRYFLNVRIYDDGDMHVPVSPEDINKVRKLLKI